MLGSKGALPLARALFRSTRLRTELQLTSPVSLCSGCEAYVVREGWEGLVRGNSEHAHVEHGETLGTAPAGVSTPGGKVPGGFVATYGEGELLKEGEGEQTLKGRYIIRVRLVLSSFRAAETDKVPSTGWLGRRPWFRLDRWNFDRNCSLRRFP